MRFSIARLLLITFALAVLLGFIARPLSMIGGDWSLIVCGPYQNLAYYCWGIGEPAPVPVKTSIPTITLYVLHCAFAIVFWLGMLVVTFGELWIRTAVSQPLKTNKGQTAPYTHWYI